MTGSRATAAAPALGGGTLAEKFAAMTKRSPAGAPPATRPAEAPAAAAEVVAEVVQAPVRAAAPAAAEPTGGAAHGAPAARVEPPTLLHPATYLCANCAGRFPARNRPTPYCSPQCTAEAKAVRYARRQHAEHGHDLPAQVKVMLHRKIVHALTECGYDKWSGMPEPDPVTPPAVHPLADYVDPMIPPADTYAVKAQELKVRTLSDNVLLACDHQNWDAVWRAWVNLHAR